MATHLEFDHFGAGDNESLSNSHGLRVRHVYGSLGGRLASQTWTNFSDAAAYPEIVVSLTGGAAFRSLRRPGA